MIKVRKSILIHAPVERVFDYLDKPEHLPEIWPSMVRVENVERMGDRPLGYDWTYKMAGMHFHGHSEIIAHKKNTRIVSKNEKGIPSTFTWTFVAEDGGTRFMVDVDYTIPSPLLAKLADGLVKRLNEREADVFLENLKTRVEHGATREETAAASA